MGGVDGDLVHHGYTCRNSINGTFSSEGNAGLAEARFLRLLAVMVYLLIEIT